MPDVLPEGRTRIADEVVSMRMFDDKTRARLERFLETHDLGAGLGTHEAPCSMAAINIVLDGTLTDDVPECMSKVIGEFIVRVQDAMPDEIRNSREWKQLLPWAVGTGREYEEERLRIVKAWAWGTVAPTMLSYGRAPCGGQGPWAGVESTSEISFLIRLLHSVYSAFDVSPPSVRSEVWAKIDPCDVLRKLIDIGSGRLARRMCRPPSVQGRGPVSRRDFSLAA